MEKTEIIKALEEKLGREITVARLQDGKYAVEYFNFSSPPPPVGHTKEEALELFSAFLMENTDE